MIENPYFCYEIYKNISVWSLNGSLRYNPCSLYKGEIGQDYKFDIAAIWNNQKHGELKIAVENQQPIQGCSYCYNAEKAGLESRRLGAANSWTNFHKDTKINLSSPQSLDYSVGNLCNLKCMICGPHSSSSWLSDYQKMYPAADIDQYKFEKFNQIEIENTEFLKNIVSVHFHGGGEPLMSDSHVNLLQAIDQARGLGDVRVFYNTNGTKKVNDDVLKLWEKCKLIEIYFSVDDVGTRFEYQRTGAKWAEVCDNINWYKTHAPHNFMYNVNCVWGYLNLYYLDELVDWYNANHTVNRYGDPGRLIFQKALGPFGISHVSAKAKATLVAKFVNYPPLIDLVNSLTVDDHSNHEKFWQYVTKIDQIRGEKFLKICPQWSSLL